VLYFISAGHPPFDAENTLAVLHKIVSERAEPLTSIRQDLPPSYVELVHKLLNRSVDRRLHDCEAVIESLAHAQTEAKQGRVARHLRFRHKGMAIAVALLAIAAIGAFAWTFGTADARRIAPIADPWVTDPGMAGAEESGVDPYVAAASARIDTAAIIGQVEFQREVRRIERELDRMENTPDRTVTPSIRSDEDAWRREFAELEASLRKLESP
jgi:hypothetical protein